MGECVYVTSNSRSLVTTNSNLQKVYDLSQRNFRKTSSTRNFICVDGTYFYLTSSWCKMVAFVKLQRDFC